MRARSLIVGLVGIFLAASATVRAHQHTDVLPADAKLGSVSFDISCKVAVKAEFNRGVALLHSFWHDEALRAFESVAASDPDCAMAYWGQAMASFHLYLSLPSSSQLSAGQAALARADMASEKS